LEHVPDHVIPHPQARLDQQLEIEVVGEGRVLLWDAWALGRAAREERWAFEALASALRVRHDGVPVYVDLIALTRGRRPLDGLAGAEDHAYFASWLVFSGAARDWTALADALAEIPAEIPGVRGSASALARGGV